MSCQLMYIEAKWNLSIWLFVFLLGFNFVLVIGQMCFRPYVMKSSRAIKKMQNPMEKLRSKPEWKLQRLVSALTSRSEIIFVMCLFSCPKNKFGEEYSSSFSLISLSQQNNPNLSVLYCVLHCSILQCVGYNLILKQHSKIKSRNLLKLLSISEVQIYFLALGVDNHWMGSIYVDGRKAKMGSSWF